MSVRNSLRQIDAVAAEELDRARRYDAAKKEQSRREVYEKALEEVESIAGRMEMQTLTEWIKGCIRTEGKLPTGREVRKRGAEICRENGHEISTGSWLGA